MTNRFNAIPMPMAFWSQVDTSAGPKDCWPWRGKRNGAGYGAFNREGYGRGAHRVAYHLAFGDPGKAYVLHRCDNPVCCNPSHLFLGTAKINAIDCAAKGRQNGAAKRRSGMAHGRAKLRNEDVLAIRGSIDSIRSLAKCYGVTPSLIGQIQAGRIWRHLPLDTGIFAARQAARVERHRASRRHGEEMPNAKLTTARVKDLRARWRAGETKAVLARRFGLSIPSVTAVITRQTWKHVP